MVCSKATLQSTKLTLRAASLDVGISLSGPVMMAVTPIPMKIVMKFLRMRIDTEIRGLIRSYLDLLARDCPIPRRGI